MKVLVTGATGFIGKVLVPILCNKGYSVRILSRYSSDISVFSGFKNLEVFYGDISDEESLIGIESGIDYVYHLAVLGHLSGVKDNLEYEAVNNQGSLYLLKRFVDSNIKKFLFTTSSAALGAISGKIVTEDDFSPPVTEYGMSKYRGEINVKKFAKEHAIPHTLVRLTHVYGPGETRDLYRIIKMIKTGIFPQIGFKKNLYPAVYIDDAVQGILLAMENGRNGEVYNISDVTSHDTVEIRKIVRDKLGLKSKLYPIIPKLPLITLLALFEKLGINFPVTKKNIEFITAGRIFSIDKAIKELGYNPKVSFDEGLRRTIDFYLKEGMI